MDGRAWLLDRIETEARAYADADPTTRAMRLGRVFAYLEVGVAFGYWSKRKASQVADMVEQRYGLRRIRRLLTRSSQTPSQGGS